MVLKHTRREAKCAYLKGFWRIHLTPRFKSTYLYENSKS